MIRALSRSTAGKVLLIAYGVTAVVCAFLPLLDHIGYELAMVLTIVAACFAPAIGFAATRIEYRARAESRRPARAAASAGLFAAAALVLPTAIILLNGLRRPICDPVAGSLWLLLLPVPTAWLSATLGALASTMFAQRRWAIAAVVAVEAGSVIISFLAGYFGPAAFGFDHFAGYYTGAARAGIPITSALVSFRAATVGWGVAIVTILGAWSPDPSARRMHRSWAIGLCIALVAISVGWGDQLGWRTTDRSLRRALAGEIVLADDHVVIHYPRTASDRFIDGLVRDVIYTSTQVKRALGITPTHPVHVWVYTSAAQKARLLGNTGIDFAKPYRHEIHVTATELPLSSLRHELIHAFAAEFAPGPWGAAGGIIPNVALIEGLAEAYDVEDGTLTLYQDARAMRELKLAPDLEKLMSLTGFGGQATSRAYAYSGAFIRYLGERFGTPAVRTLYASNDFASLGDVRSIIRDFEQMLDTVQSNANARSTAARRHSVLPITRRTCAREIYAITDSAYALAANRLWDDALRMFDRACALQPENPDLLNGKLGLAIRMRPPTIAPIMGIADSLLAHPRLDPTLEAQTHLQVGDAYLRLHDLAGARAEYQAASRIPSAPETRRAVAARLLSLGDSTRLAAIRLYYNIEGTEAINVFRLIDAAQTGRPDPLVLYLVGRQYHVRGVYESAIRTLSRADALGIPDPDIAREAVRLLAVAYASRNQCDAAANSVERLRALGGARAELAAAADRVDRCRFAVAKGWKPL